MCGNSDEIVFLLPFSACSLPLLNVFNNEAGLHGDQLQQSGLIVRKRTGLLKLKHDFPHQIPGRIDRERKIMHPASLNLLRIGCQVLGLGKRHKRPIGLEDFLDGIEREGVHTLDTFCIPQFWNESQKETQPAHPRFRPC